MLAVIFELEPQAGKQSEYLNEASFLSPLLNEIEGFISVERFESLSTPGKLLSLSFWKDEESIRVWRTKEAHREAQYRGRQAIFADYRLRVASVVRDYGMDSRQQVPLDSQCVHG